MTRTALECKGSDSGAEKKGDLEGGSTAYWEGGEEVMLAMVATVGLDGKRSPLPLSPWRRS